MNYIAVAGSNPANQCRKTKAVAQLVEHEIWPIHSSVRFKRNSDCRLEYIWIVSCDRRTHNSESASWEAISNLIINFVVFLANLNPICESLVAIKQSMNEQGEADQA